MRRITPEEVINAYQETGLHPRQGIIFSKYFKVACGIGALASFELGHLEFPKSIGPRTRNNLLAEWLGVEADYCRAFQEGFDIPLDHPDPSLFLSVFDSDEWKQGFQDGLAVRDAIAAEGGFPVQ